MNGVQGMQMKIESLTINWQTRTEMVELDKFNEDLVDRVMELTQRI